MDDSGNNCCYQKLEVAEKSVHVFTMPALPSITPTDGYIKSNDIFQASNIFTKIFRYIQTYVPSLSVLFQK